MSGREGAEPLLLVFLGRERSFAPSLVTRPRLRSHFAMINGQLLHLPPLLPPHWNFSPEELQVNRPLQCKSLRPAVDTNKVQRLFSEGGYQEAAPVSAQTEETGCSGHVPSCPAHKSNSRKLLMLLVLLLLLMLLFSSSIPDPPSQGELAGGCPPSCLPAG